MNITKTDKCKKTDHHFYDEAQTKINICKLNNEVTIFKTPQ